MEPEDPRVISALRRASAEVMIARLRDEFYRELASMNPTHAQGPKDDDYCFFCHSWQPPGTEPPWLHATDCLWLRAFQETRKGDPTA